VYGTRSRRATSETIAATSESRTKVPGRFMRGW
jgi:hypothetical protein